jgi:hypothetical protein
MAVKPAYLALAGAGAIVAVAGVKGWGIGHTFRDVISGQDPRGNVELASQIQGAEFPDTGGTSGGNAPPSGGGKVNAHAAANMALARLSVAVRHPSWAVGSQWAAWKSLWMRESGWSSTAWNPSGAYGIAQALGHAKSGECAVGPRSVGSTSPGLNCAYGSGPGGLSPRSAKAANAGVNLPQIQWGIGYIETQYGSPQAAWNHEVANGWY